MSEMQSGERAEAPVEIPALTLGWRMQMAMKHGGRSIEHMAVACGVGRSTISRWINDQGKRPPRRGDIQIWARECRVPEGWLLNAEREDGEPMAGQPTVAYIEPFLSLVDDEEDGERDFSPAINGHLAPVANFG